MNISVKNDFSIKNSLSLNYKNYNWKDFSCLDSRTVSNPFHDGTFCEHPRPLTSDSSTFYQGAVILEWIFIVTDDVSRTTSVHVTNLGYKSNCMTHLCDSYHPRWVRPDSWNYQNLKFNILLLFILFRIVFSWIFLIICTFQIFLI